MKTFVQMWKVADDEEIPPSIHEAWKNAFTAGLVHADSEVAKAAKFEFRPSDVPMRLNFLSKYDREMKNAADADPELKQMSEYAGIYTLGRNRAEARERAVVKSTQKLKMQADNEPTLLWDRPTLSCTFEAEVKESEVDDGSGWEVSALRIM